jgi:hypothetical protein
MTMPATKVTGPSLIRAAPAYLNSGLCQGGGGEWLWWMVWRGAPWMPGLIWVRDLVVVGDVMVDRSVRVE